MPRLSCGHLFCFLGVSPVFCGVSPGEGVCLVLLQLSGAMPGTCCMVWPYSTTFRTIMRLIVRHDFQAVDSRTLEETNMCEAMIRNPSFLHPML